jgi:uncharacterized protein
MRQRALVAFATLVAWVWAIPALCAGFTVPPTPSHYVTDTAGALTDATKAVLESELAAYQKSSGHQIIVWIGDTTGDVPLETWTGDSAHQWRIGRRGHDDGAILFLFIKDHRIRIEVGYGLEGSLTDADSSRIIRDDITPRMRSGNVDDAVSSGVAAMLNTISPSYKSVTPPPVAESSGGNIPAGLAIAFFAFFGMFMVFIVFVIVMRVVGEVRYGYLVLREGSTKAKADMKHWAFWSGTAGGFIGGSSFGSGGGGFDGGGGGFSAGGGDFGGGGASGSW